MTLPESSKILACRLTRVLFAGMDALASILCFSDRSVGEKHHHFYHKN
jgi:hypothetical protein